MNDPGIGAVSEAISQILSGHPRVRFAYLFGSAAKGTARPDSDIDVAVFFGSGAEPNEAPSGTGGGDRVDRARRALELESELERGLERPVQVVSLDDAPLGLAHNVLRSGKLLHCPDERAHRHFYVGHARRYYDMEPARRIFDRYRKRRIEEGRFGGRGGDGP